MVLGTLLSSCILAIEDENFFEVEKIPNPALAAKLNYSYNDHHLYPVKDTVWLEDEITLRLVGGKIYGYQVLIDGEPLLSRKNNSSFTIKKGNKELGAYRLTIKQDVKSGTGSLADNLSAEYVPYAEDFVMMIGPNTFVPQINSVELKDGAVQLNWKPYPRSNFQSYEIKKYYDTFGKPGTYATPYRQLQVLDQHQAFFNDTTYVGGIIWYELEVNIGGNKLSSEKFRVSFDYTPEMKLDKISANRMRLSWKVPPYYQSIKYFTVEQGSEIILDQVPPEDSSIEFESNILFGEKKTYWLVLNAKVEEFSIHGPDKKSFSETLTYGEQIPPFKTILYSKPKKAFYLFHTTEYNNPWPDGIYKLDATTLTILDSIAPDKGPFYSDSRLVMSFDGEQLYFMHGAIIQKIESGRLAFGESFHIGKSLDRYRKKDDFGVSNNGFIVHHDYNYQVNILDFESRNILLTARSGSASHISADGSCFINGSDMYTYNGVEFIKSGTLPFVDVRYVRFIDSQEKVFIATEEKIILYDIKRNVEYSSFDFKMPLHGIPHLDLESMIYGVRNNWEIDFINIETGEKPRIEVYMNGKYILEGNIIFEESGFALKDY